MLIRPAIGDTDPIRYRRPTPDGQFSGNILDEAMRPWRNRYNAFEKKRGYGWTPIEHARNKQFRFCFNDLVNNRGGVQVGRRFTTPAFLEKMIEKGDAGRRSLFRPHRKV